MYTYLKNKNLKSSEIEVRLKNRNTFITTLLTMLTVLITILFFVFNQSNSKLYNSYSTVNTQLNQIETISIKELDYVPLKNQKKKLNLLSMQISRLQSDLNKNYDKISEKDDNLLYSLAGGMLVMLICTFIAFIFQLSYSRSLYKLLHEVENK